MISDLYAKSKKELKNLNGLKADGHLGLYKKGHCISKKKYNLVCNYLEKINYALQDMEEELRKPPDRSILVCVIAYTCWIQESVNELKKCYKSYVFDDFTFGENIIEENNGFIKAIRSFALAHPFTTTRHGRYGFNGTLHCIDIRPSGSDTGFLLADNNDKYYIDTKGKVKYSNQEVDYWLYIYNDNKYDDMFKQYIGISTGTICKIANDYIDYLYALDKHMSKVNIRKETKQ